MEISNPDEVPVVVDAAPAREVLRPALLLWVTAFVVLGAWYQIDAYLQLSSPISAATAGGLLAAVVAAFAWRDRESCRLFARSRRDRTGLCVLVGVSGGLLLAWLERSLSPGSSPWIVGAEHGAGWSIWRSLLSSAVVPAFAEELMFRGMILQRLRRVVAVPLAIAVQASLFALLHTEPGELLSLFAFGCLAGFLRIAAGALWPCVLMHLVWNGWIVLAAYRVL